MKASIGFLTASLFANIAHATVVWSGSFDGYATAATFDNWLVPLPMYHIGTDINI